jgi:hypothetical protein
LSLQGAAQDSVNQVRVTAKNPGEGSTRSCGGDTEQMSALEVRGVDAFARESRASFLARKCASGSGSPEPTRQTT